MKIPRRLPHLLIGLLTLTAFSAPRAQAHESATSNYPNKPLHLIVPYPAGGGADYWGQLVARKLADKLGQPVEVTNVPGAGGNNGTAVAARAAPDGYTLLLGSVGPLAVHPFTYAKLDFAPEQDFVPIALLESSPILLVASPTVHTTSAVELLERVRSKPGSITYASNGNGSPEQVAGELFKTRLKVDIQHLPYDGAGPARKAVLAGQASLMFDPCKGAIAAIHKGLQTPLAVATRTRLPMLPEVPTFGEVGLPHYELRIWTGVLAPAGTPKEIVAKLNAAVRDMLRTPEIQKEITDEGGEAGATTPQEFATFLKTERRNWSALVAESGVPRVQ
ncbi:MAG TPA: tripartite tricarboxylate transporter substrate-binding protein [Steroidobacteraceae bacterium]